MNKLFLLIICLLVCGVASANEGGKRAQLQLKEWLIEADKIEKAGNKDRAIGNVKISRIVKGEPMIFHSGFCEVRHSDKTFLIAGVITFMKAGDQVSYASKDTVVTMGWDGSEAAYYGTTSNLPLDE